MLVVEDKQALVMQLKNATRVLTAVPTAAPLYLGDKQLTTVHHGIDEVRVLRNLGIDAPSPIMYYYDWPGRFAPFEHQKATAAFLTLTQRGLVLNEIGTGKSNSALWAADYLMNEGHAKRVLIVSPLSTLERVWHDAIFEHLSHRTAVVLYGSAARRKKMLAHDADFYIINHDGFSILSNQMNDMFDIVIVDEAAVYRNPSTKRFKMLRKWMDNQPTTTRLWLMTGTPTPNEPTDAWALAKLVNSPFIPPSYHAFREQVMFKHGMYTWLPRPNSAELVKDVLQPSVRYTRDECLDLPDTIVQARRAELTAEQGKHYKDMVRNLVTEAAAGTITAANEAVKLQKLIQIACGVAYDTKGKHLQLDCSPRINLVKEIIEEAGEKVIIFVPLTGTLNMLEQELSKKWTVAVVNGAVSAAKRNVIFDDFQSKPDPRVLIAHPATMAHGLTLTAASTIVWYGPINSNEQYTQANGRIERTGKKHTSNVIHIESTTLERKMYTRLQHKQKLQGVLLDLIQQEMEVM